MTVDEIRDRAVTLERKILQLVKDFQHETEVGVSGIEVRTVEVTALGGRRMNVLIDVEVQLSL